MKPSFQKFHFLFLFAFFLSTKMFSQEFLFEGQVGGAYQWGMATNCGMNFYSEDQDHRFEINLGFGYEYTIKSNSLATCFSYNYKHIGIGTQLAYYYSLEDQTEENYELVLYPHFKSSLFFSNNYYLGGSLGVILPLDPLFEELQQTISSEIIRYQPVYFGFGLYFGFRYQHHRNKKIENKY